ncbi:hypothetical protein B0H13DRAFT_1639635, partial [Mycena leptocephala]
WITNACSPQEIRDKIMGGDSAFQKKLIDYLEAAHQGEFLHGSMADVRHRVNADPDATPEEEDLQSGPTYQVPTQTLPSVPPLLCQENHGDVECLECQNLKNWWNSYEHEVDDILLRPNVHKCRESVQDKEDEAAKKDWRNLKPKSRKRTYHERRGCLSKRGVCKARFPRDIFETTHVDKDGHINIKKHEAQLNTFSRVLTYFSRSNTDVTSLLSGTAFKAVVSYVSDYVSKLGLKIYQAFASVFDVFERNAETLETGATGPDTAKTFLMRQMINSMSKKKMEIGSPMAVMYVLGNPDHYCSHKYVNFAWRSYRREFEEELQLNDELDRADSEVTNNEDASSDRVIEADYDAESDLDDFIDDDLSSRCTTVDDRDSSDEDSDWNSEDEDAVVVEKETSKQKAHRIRRLPFLPAHKTAFLTHSVHCDFRKLDKIIPNFMGGAVPWADKGDREYYCMTVMTLFKPWRSPADLKDNESTWDQIFYEHSFTDRQKQLIRNLNIRYECNDARDDHYAIMRKKMAEQGEFTSKSMLGVRDEFINDLEAGDFGDEDMDCDDDITVGRRTAALFKSRDSIKDVLQGAKWLNMPRDGLLDIDTTRYVAPYKARRTWAEVVNSERKLYTANKLSDMPLPEKLDKHKVKTADKVEVVPHDYLNPTSKLSKEAKDTLINDICNQPGLELNQEQERAFRLVAEHASSPQPTPLKMYLGATCLRRYSSERQAAHWIFAKQ